jgi:hypothetical protein
MASVVSRIFRTFSWLSSAGPGSHGDGISHLLVLQQLDVQISLGRPRCAGDVAQPCGGEGERGLTVRERAHDTRGALGKPNAGIRGDQPDTLQSAFLGMLEERAPARLILLRPLANAENLPITTLVHADRNQQRDVAYLASPT